MNVDVWAPRAGKVRLVVDGVVHGMTRDRDGWWTAPDGLVGVGSRYGYLLDDDPRPLPDPRSRRQPDGVHDLSEATDPSAFGWTDQQRGRRPRLIGRRQHFPYAD